MAQAVMGIPGLIGEVIESEDKKAQSLTQRVVDHLSLRLMGIMAIGAVAMLILASGIAVVVERIVDRIDGLRGVKKSVEQFGHALKEQERIIEEFRPLLELSDKVVEISAKVEQKTEEVKENTRDLDELKANYPLKAELLERVSDMITRVETDLPGRISNPPGLEEKAIQMRIGVSNQIEEEKRQMKELAARLNGLIASAEKKAEKIAPLVAGATLQTAIKEVQIASLQQSVGEFVAITIEHRTGVPNGDTIQQPLA
jgi:uncharacterized coiled-coil DUF342 family protein